MRTFEGRYPVTDPIDDLFGDDAEASGQKPDGGKLRKQLEAVLEQNRLLQQQITETRAVERNRALSSLFEKHKIPAKAAKWFEGEPTDEAATAFVQEYGEVWGASSATATTTPEQQAQAQRIQDFNSGAPEAVGLDLSEEQVRAKFAETNSKAEVLALLADLGGGVITA